MLHRNLTDSAAAEIAATVLVSMGICGIIVCLIAIPAVIVGVCIAARRKTKRTAPMPAVGVIEGPGSLTRSSTIMATPIQVAVATANIPTAAVTGLVRAPTVRAAVAMPPVSLEDMEALPVAFAQPEALPVAVAQPAEALRESDDIINL